MAPRPITDHWFEIAVLVAGGADAFFIITRIAESNFYGYWLSSLSRW